MDDLVPGGLAHVLVVLLLVVGLYGAIQKGNLLRKLIGLNIFQSAIFLFFIHGAAKLGATVPVLDPALGQEAAHYANPLPHVVVLTAIVVGVALTGVALTLLVTIHREHGTLEEEEIRRRAS